MTQHPITPPTELVQQWETRIFDEQENVDVLLIEAYKAGADQELEACCALMDDWGLDETDLRFARRPKPPSSKQQALEALDRILRHPSTELGDAVIIRHALEALPE